MLIKTKGIVFRVVKFGETSVIADIYTEAKGLQSYIINSVRTAKPKFHSGLIQLMSIVDMVVYAREGKELNHIKELRAAYPYHTIPFNIIKGTIGTFMLELAQKTIKESEPNPELFDFLYQSFIRLDSTTSSFNNTHLSFMVKLCQYLGIAPEAISSSDEGLYLDFQSGTLVKAIPVHRQFMDTIQTQRLQWFLQTPFEENHLLKMTTDERRNFVQQMIKYYEIHIPNFHELKTFSILQTVLA